MQFYLNGYNPGDPDIQAAAPGAEARPAALPDTTDVLIVGGGPAGAAGRAVLGLSRHHDTRRRSSRGSSEVGQADGVACRTVEMFDAFGLSGKLIREAYWVNETVFWRPSPEDRLKKLRARTMKAAFLIGHGGNEVVAVGERPAPRRSPGEILIRMRAATVNRVDLYMRDSGAGITHTLPQIMGVDGAGVIEEADSACIDRPSRDALSRHRLR